MRVGKVAKQVVVIVVALAILALILAAMSGAFTEKVKPGNEEATRPTVGDMPTDEVHKIVQIQHLEVSGTVRAAQRTAISARIMAAIIELPVNAGDKVKKGDLLVALDDRDLQAALEQAKQGLVAAQAQLDNAARDYERFKEAWEKGAVSRQQYDQAATGYRVAQAQLEQAREAVAGAEAQLSYSRIHAPGDGVVVDTILDVGDTAGPGQPILNLYDPDAMRLEAAVPEALSEGLEVGESLQIILRPTQDNAPAVTGTIAEIVPAAEAASRSVLVKVRIPQEVPNVVEGAFGRLLIPSRERVRLCLAQSAVRSVGQLRFVDVVRDDGTLERRMVTLGESSPFGRVEALSGAEAGEKVVLHGPPPQPLPEGVRLFGEGGVVE